MIETKLPYVDLCGPCVVWGSAEGFPVGTCVRYPKISSNPRMDDCWWTVSIWFKLNMYPLDLFLTLCYRLGTIHHGSRSLNNGRYRVPCRPCWWDIRHWCGLPQRSEETCFVCMWFFALYRWIVCMNTVYTVYIYCIVISEFIHITSQYIDLHLRAVVSSRLPL